MARGELIGLMTCPECGYDEAEVKNDKGGNPYRFCPDCTAQYFTRGNSAKVKNLLAKIRQGEAPPGNKPASVAPVVPSREDTTAAALKKPAAPSKPGLSWNPLGL